MWKALTVIAVVYVLTLWAAVVYADDSWVGEYYLTTVGCKSKNGGLIQFASVERMSSWSVQYLEAMQRGICGNFGGQKLGRVAEVVVTGVDWEGDPIALVQWGDFGTGEPLGYWSVVWPAHERNENGGPPGNI